MLVAVVSACAREPVAPSHAEPHALRETPRAEVASVVPVAALLDSFSIGGMYTVLPRGGYWGGSSYARSPEKEQYAGTVSLHPSGLEFPVGLPIRILAEGHDVSSATAAFQRDYCSVPSHATDSRCAVASFTYTVHGLADGPGVLRPYEPGLGLALTWSRTAGYSDRFYGLFPSAEFFRGRVPSADTATVRELHFRRNGCCYYIPWGTTAAWETYEGSWRFGAVPDDGGQAELGVPPVLRLLGPRTDAPMTTSVEFTVATTTGDSIETTRWWYARAANNAFDGEPVPLVTITQPWTMQIPRYPDGQRAVFEALPSCAGHATCTYQPLAAGAVVVEATLADGRVLAARNAGASGAHVRITVDSTTLTYGDTTVFRVTAPGANELRVTGYQFRPVAAVVSDAVVAVRETPAVRRVSVSARQSDHARRPSAPMLATQPSSPAVQTAETPASVTVVHGRRAAHFLDAAVECGETLAERCYDDPLQTGYEIVTAVVDRKAQRDSVLVTVVPALKLTCSDRHGVSDAMGGATVVRADTVSCKASIAPEGASDTLTVTEWDFASRDGTLARARREVNPTFSPDSTVWAGPMITSGTVTVTASINNFGPLKRSVGITVSPRNWRHDSIPGWPVLPRVVGQGWLPATPSNVHDLGQTIFAFRGDDVADSTNSHGLVGEGPNAFVYYVAKLPPLLDSLQIAINNMALSVGSSFWVQQSQFSASTVFNSENRCYRDDVTSLDTRDKILKHEGSRWEVNPVSHAGVFKQLTFARVVPAAESVFSKAEGGIQGLRNRWGAVVFPVQLQVYALAGKPVDSANPVYFGTVARNNFGCHFTYTP